MLAQVFAVAKCYIRNAGGFHQGSLGGWILEHYVEDALLNVCCYNFCSLMGRAGCPQWIIEGEMLKIKGTQF